MRTMHFLKISLGLVVLIGLGLISYKTFAHGGTHKDSFVENAATAQVQRPETPSSQDLSADITMTMDSNATEDNLEEMKHVLKEQDINVSFSNVTRNEEGKITGIKIELTDDSNGKAVSQISSFAPIPNISFGRKDGMLFINQEGHHGMGRLLFGSSNDPFMENDSLFEQQFSMLKKFNLQDFFNNTSPGQYNGMMADFDAIRKQMEDEMNSSMSNHKFQFMDDPNTNRLIIIDGKESDFETLTKLADEDKIRAVDALKPETAMSIYGKKAHDGALIVSTK